MSSLFFRSSSVPNSMKVRSIANKKRRFIEFGSEEERRMSETIADVVYPHFVAESGWNSEIGALGRKFIVKQS